MPGIRSTAPSVALDWAASLREYLQASLIVDVGVPHTSARPLQFICRSAVEAPAPVDRTLGVITVARLSKCRCQSRSTVGRFRISTIARNGSSPISGRRPVWRLRSRCGTVGRAGQPVAKGVGDCLGSIADARLGEQMVDVALDRGLADVQPLGDLAVGQPFGDEC
jgi:hypothetical protein